LLFVGIRQGTLLENDVARIFKLAGFKVDKQIRLKGYEIDVYAQFKNFHVIIECKQYEKSNINVRNLIHLWDSKNKEIEANKIIIAFFGIKPQTSDYSLAKKYGISLWGEHDINRHLDKLIDNKNQAANFLLEEIGYTIGKKISNTETHFKGNRLNDLEIPVKNVEIFTPDEVSLGVFDTHFVSQSVLFKPQPGLKICMVNDGRAKKFEWLSDTRWGYCCAVTEIYLNKQKEVIEINEKQIKNTLFRGKYTGNPSSTRYNYGLLMFGLFYKVCYPVIISLR